MENPQENFGEIYHQGGGIPNQIMRFDHQRERNFGFGNQNLQNERGIQREFLFSEDEMLKEYNQFRPNQRNMMRNNPQRNRMIERENWEQDYNQELQTHNQEWTTEYQKSREWDEEYSNDWVGDYQSKMEEMDDDLEKIYNQGELEKEDWTNEYDEYNMEKAFEGNVTEKEEQEDDEWFNSYLQNEKQFSEESMKNVTHQLLSIQDPKLQNSNFMKFIEKVHTGEYSFEGNSLVSKPRINYQKTVTWEDEYGNFESPQEMVHDYQNFQQIPNNERGMVEEYKNFNSEQEMVKEYMQEQEKKYQERWREEYGEYLQDDVDEYDEIWNEEGSWNTEYLTPKQYQFSQQNPYMELDNPFEKGLELMDNGKIKKKNFLENNNQNILQKLKRENQGCYFGF